MADRYFHIIDDGIPKASGASVQDDVRDLRNALSQLLEELSFVLRHLDARNFTKDGAREVVALGTDTEEGE